MGGITIKNAGVNSGKAIWLDSGSITIGLKNLIRTNPVEGKVDDSGNFDISEIDYGGVENPAISVTGTIDVDLAQLTGLTIDEETNCSSATWNLLKELGLAKDYPTYLTVGTGVTPTYLTGRIILTSPNANKIKVHIETITVKIDTTAEKGHLWDYTIAMRETK